MPQHDEDSDEDDDGDDECDEDDDDNDDSGNSCAEHSCFFLLCFRLVFALALIFLETKLSKIFVPQKIHPTHYNFSLLFCFLSSNVGFITKNMISRIFIAWISLLCVTCSPRLGFFLSNFFAG